MRLLVASAMCAAGAFAVPAHAAPPAAPVVTVGATDIKQLQFDWAAVPKTSVYELWFKANDGAPWIKYTETSAQHLRIRINVSVHLLDWRVARYRLAACNLSGCTNSNEVGVADLAADATGYLKPNLTGVDHWFGHSVALSADGKTLAVETGEQRGTAQDSAVVNIYRKTTATSGWRREARIGPSAVQAGTSQPYVGSPLALSGDGNLLALGLFTDDMLGPNTPDDNGAVYLFRREGTSWRQVQKLQGTNYSADWYGYDVELDDAGTILAVTHMYVDARPAMGTTDIYRPTSEGWQFSHTVPVPVDATGYRAFCIPISLSGDGRTFFRACNHSNREFVQVFDTTTWIETARIAAGDNSSLDTNFDGTRVIVRDWSGAKVFALQAGVWSVEGSFGVSNASSSAPQHPTVAISRDGKLAVGGTYYDSTPGVGVIYPPLQPGAPSNPSGSVYVYEHKSVGWRLRRIIKPPTVGYQSFGNSLALGDNGRVLAVGAPFDSSAATGINGDPTDTSAPERGAVWLY